MTMVKRLFSKARFWKGGPLLRNVSGVIEARNAADSAYAIMRGATSVGNSDLTPKAYVDTAIDTDVAAAFKDPTFQDSTDPTKEATLDLSGITTATERTLTLQDKDITIADTADITTAVAAALLSNSEARLVQLAYTDTGDNNIGAVVPEDATHVIVLVQVTETFDGTTPVLIIGDSGDDNRFMETTDNDLTTAGLYQKAVIYAFPADTQLLANLTIGGTPSQGACDIIVLFGRAAS